MRRYGHNTGHSNLLDDQRHGTMLGDRQSGREFELRGGDAGYADRKLNSGRADGDFHGSACQRHLQQPLHSGDDDQRQHHADNYQHRRLLERGHCGNDDQRHGHLLAHGNLGGGQQL